jgi:hypothetical protein
VPTNEGGVCGEGLVCTEGACGPPNPCLEVGVCDDGNECTADSCENVDGQANCTNDPVEGGTSCTAFANGYCTVDGDCVSGVQESEDAIVCSPFFGELRVPFVTSSSVGEPPQPNITIALTTRVQSAGIMLADIGFDPALQQGAELVSADFDITVVNGTPTLITQADPNVPRPIADGFEIDTGDKVSNVTVDAGPAALFVQLTNAQVRARSFGGLITVQVGPGIDNCVMESGSQIYPIVGQ